MSSAGDRSLQMESPTEFNTGDVSPVLEPTETTQKRRESRQKRRKTHEQQGEAMRSATGARRRRGEKGDTSSSRSPSPDISPNVNASKKKRS